MHAVAFASKFAIRIHPEQPPPLAVRLSNWASCLFPTALDCRVLRSVAFVYTYEIWT